MVNINAIQAKVIAVSIVRVLFYMKGNFKVFVICPFFSTLFRVLLMLELRCQYSKPLILEIFIAIEWNLLLLLSNTIEEGKNLEIDIVRVTRKCNLQFFLEVKIKLASTQKSKLSADEDMSVFSPMCDATHLSKIEWV